MSKVEYAEISFVESIVKPLVALPDQVKVERTMDERGVLLSLTTAKEDAGRIIGKKGATIQSIRTLLRTLGAKHQAQYSLRINDYKEQNPFDGKGEEDPIDGPAASK